MEQTTFSDTLLLARLDNLTRQQDG